MPKSPEYITTGYNTVGKVPQNTRKLLDLVLLFPFSGSPSATKGTHCKATTALSSVAVILITTSTLEELAFQESVSIPTDSSLTCATLLPFLLSKPTAHYQGQNLVETDLICKSPPSCYVRAMWLAGDGSCEQHSALQSSGGRKKYGICSSHQRPPAEGWAESDVSRKQQGEKGGNTSTAKGRQLKIHICVKLEWGHAHTCQTPQLSHPVHTQQWELCVVQVQLIFYIYVYKQHSIHFNSKDKHKAFQNTPQQ